MARGSKAQEGVTIGFLGTGEMEVDPATDLIEQFINESVKPEEPAKFIFPLTSAEFSDSMDRLAEMARKSKIAYECIVTPEDKKRRAFQEVISGAVHTHTVTDIWTQMEQILVDAPKSALFVLWDDKRDEELQEICFKFVDADINVLDLTNNLVRLGREEGDEGEAPDEDEEEDEGTDEAEEVRELEAEAVVSVFTRAQLEKMSHSDVKDVAVGLGLPPRKARENMIVAILEAQGSPEAVSEAPERPQAVTAAPVDVDALSEALTAFRKGLADDLEEFRLAFASTVEGILFNVAPEKPMEVEDEPAPEPSGRRRLVRR